MNMPGFTADRAHSRPARAVDPSSCKDTPSQLSAAQRFGASNKISPARRDETQELYAECLAECRSEGGRNCTSECAEAVYSPGGGPPGESGLPVYGNYCGPFHGDRDYLAPHVDDVDLVCKMHDKCYDEKGYSNCACDRALILQMPFAIATTPSLAGKAAGAAAITAFRSLPCTCWGVPPPMFVGVGGVGPCV